MFKNKNIKKGATMKLEANKNIEEVKNFLEIKNIDYKCLVLEHIDFKEQVKYFYNADMIIGVHGGGLTNCIFSKENTTIIKYMRPFCILNINI